MDGILRCFEMDPNEEMKRIMRPHPSFFLGRVIVGIFLFVLPFFFIVPLFERGFWGIAVFASLVIIALLHATRAWLFWYYNSLILSPKRIIIVSQKGFFDRKVQDVDMKNIVDLYYERRNAFDMLFNVGRVVIRVPHMNGELSWDFAKDPKQCVAEVRSMMQEKRNEVLSVKRTEG